MHFKNSFYSDTYNVPSQELPLPEKPDLQVHLYVAGRFRHVALSWQGLFEHSSISERLQENLH